MVGKTRALRSIRMEGLQRFCKQNKQFCMQKERMDGKLSQTELSSFELLSNFDLASCFFIPSYGSCIQTKFCVIWKQKLISSHFIPYFVSKIAYKASSLRVPNLVTKL